MNNRIKLPVGGAKKKAAEAMAYIIVGLVAVLLASGILAAIVQVWRWIL